ncbi:MAG: winged helix-turn-helix transcriptional regulator [Alphaproteobacteria bacterium]
MTPLEEAILLLLKEDSRIAIARLAKMLDQPQSAILRAITQLEIAGRVTRDGNHVDIK